MPTTQQLIRHGREKQTAKAKCPALEGNPQERGVCLSVTTTSPKTNSCYFSKSRVWLLW